jgi:hypothetical protein
MQAKAAWSASWVGHTLYHRRRALTTGDAECSENALCVMYYCVKELLR